MVHKWKWVLEGFFHLIRLTDGSCRLSDLYVDSPDSSEYSTGSTLLNYVAGDKTACSEAVHHVVAEQQTTHIGHHNSQANVVEDIICCAPSSQSKEISKRKNITWQI